MCRVAWGPLKGAPCAFTRWTAAKCQPACADAEHGAILFGDLNNPDSEIAKRVASYPLRQIRENLNLNTGVRYSGI